MSKITAKIALMVADNPNKREQQTADLCEKMKTMFKSIGCQGEMKVYGNYTIPSMNLYVQNRIIMAECDLDL